MYIHECHMFYLFMFTVFLTYDDLLLFLSSHVSCFCFFFFSSRRRHTRCGRDWSSDVCSSDLLASGLAGLACAIAPMLMGLVATLNTSAFDPLAWTALAYLLVKAGREDDGRAQIGRASCRERV